MVDIIKLLLFWGREIFFRVKESLKKIAYRINNVKITKNSIGTIKELTSINPSVSRSKKIIASISINNVPNIFGIWKN